MNSAALDWFPIAPMSARTVRRILLRGAKNCNIETNTARAR